MRNDASFHSKKDIELRFEFPIEMVDHGIFIQTEKNTSNSDFSLSLDSYF